MATYKEHWHVVSINFKGGSVDKNVMVVAGTQSAPLGLQQIVAPRKRVSA